MLKKLPYMLTLSCLLAAPWTFADVRTDVNVASPWEISGIDPATDGYIFQRMAVMETLTNTDANGALVPGLATKWSASEDGLIWNFTLRNASFHDGTSLTADKFRLMVVALLSNSNHRTSFFLRYWRTQQR